MDSNSDPIIPGHRRRSEALRFNNSNSLRLTSDKLADVTPEAAKIQQSIEVQSHPIFRCRWKNCRAQLHNIETLCKHVKKVHRPALNGSDEQGFICWWKDCEFLRIYRDGGIKPKRLFDTKEEWISHINEAHIHTLALTHGHGPSTSHIDPQVIARDKQRYLRDGRGRLVTTRDSIGGITYPPDAMTLTKVPYSNETKEGLRDFIEVHNEEGLTPKTYAEEKKRAMTAKKMMIGPGMARGGCTLVNEARRSTLIQNQGLARVVDKDY